MNIDQAKTVPLSVILHKLNLKPSKVKENESWYRSPFRNEKTASFKVNTKHNIWYDFGEGAGGDSVEFVRTYLKSINENNTVSDALRWIKNMAGYAPVIASVQAVDYSLKDKSLLLKDRTDISHPALIHYLKKRGIRYNVAQTYLEQARVFNKQSEKTFFALALRNEDGGYEIRNPLFKGCIGTKSISFVRGTQPKPPGINIFEGFMDFLSAIESQKGVPFVDDTIILNSLSCLKKATPYIHEYGYKLAYTWMDNDKAGDKGTIALANYFRSQQGLDHLPMNDMYKPFKDVNEWHMNKLGL